MEPTEGGSKPQSETRWRVRAQTTFENTRERVVGLVKKERYEKALKNIHNVFKEQTADYPEMALTLDLVGKGSESDETCTLIRANYGGGENLEISLRKGEEIVNLNLSPNSKLEVRAGNFSAPFKRMLMQVERQLPHTDVEASPEMKAIKEIEDVGKEVLALVERNPQSYGHKKSDSGSDMYFIHGKFKDTVPLFGGLRYIREGNISKVISALEHDDVLVNSGGVSEHENYGFFLFISKHPKWGIKMHARISYPGVSDKRQEYRAEFSLDGKFVNGEIQDDPSNPFTPKRLNSSEGSQVVGELNRVLAIFRDNPEDPKTSIFPDKGYVRLDDEGRVIQITTGIFDQIDKEIENAHETVSFSGDYEKYKEKLKRLKEVLFNKVKARKMSIVGEDGELIAPTEITEDLSLDQLLGKQKSKRV